MVDVLSLLAAAGGVGGFVTIMGVAYWLGGNDAFTFYREFFVEYLASEARRVVRLALATPLSREEWEKLKEYLDKSERGELALEEADEFLELARKVVKEYGEYPGAWKLHTYATITRALTAKKYAEKGGREPGAPVSRPRRRFAPTCAALGAARGASERPSRRPSRLEPGARAPFGV